MPYIITEKTLAIIPEAKKSKVLEYNNNAIVKEETLEIISKNCQINGSTLDGRQKGSSYLIGTTYKPPIILSNEKRLILIPTHSHRNKNCSWVILKNLLNYYPHRGNVLIEFHNHEKIVLNISYTIFDKQVLRATRLESTLRGRNNKKYL